MSRSASRKLASRCVRCVRRPVGGVHRFQTNSGDRDMRSTAFVLAGAVLVATVLTGHAFAGANDYVFEPVKAEVKQANDAVVGALFLPGHFCAGANVYVFNRVKAEVKQAYDAVGAVRLKHKATGKPI